MSQIRKIISGGQTGIDRMGLEIGTDLGLETGGCAPQNYMTENGPDISLRDAYKLRTVSYHEKNEFARITGRTDRYTARTYINARDSDATVYFSTDRNSPGSKTTARACSYFKKPFIVNPNIDSLVEFLRENAVHVLNVAGNRASKLSARDRVNFCTILEESIRIVNSD